MQAPHTGSYTLTAEKKPQNYPHDLQKSHIIEEDALNHLVEVYSQPGAFTASLGWYRCSSNPVTAYTSETAPAPADRLAVPTTVLWQEFDPIFPRSWSDRLNEFFVDVTLEPLAGVGHYTPLEAPDEFAAAIKKRLGE